MTRSKFFLILILFTLVACSSNTENIKKREEAYRNVAEEYMRMGQYTLALRELLKAQAVYEKDAYLMNDLGLTYMAKEKLDIAVTYFKKAIDLKPDYAVARNNLGTAYLADKKWDEAIDTFKILTKDLLYATPHYPLCNMGWAYYNKKDYDMAEKYYREALDLNPKFVIALRGLAKTLIAKGKVPDALELLYKAIQLSPKFVELYFDLAEGYQLTGDKDNALRYYQRVIDLSPESKLAIDAMEKIKAINQ